MRVSTVGVSRPPNTYSNESSVSTPVKLFRPRFHAAVPVELLAYRLKSGKGQPEMPHAVKVMVRSWKLVYSCEMLVKKGFEFMSKLRTVGGNTGMAVNKLVGALKVTYDDENPVMQSIPVSLLVPKLSVASSGNDQHGTLPVY